MYIECRVLIRGVFPGRRYLSGPGISATPHRGDRPHPFSDISDEWPRQRKVFVVHVCVPGIEGWGSCGSLNISSVIMPSYRIIPVHWDDDVCHEVTPKTPTSAFPIRYLRLMTKDGLSTQGYKIKHIYAR